MIKLYLFDIEGTTTDINFVHKVLFPYSFEKMESFILENQKDDSVIKIVEGVKQTVELENQKQISLIEAIAQLKTWIKEDRKHPSLKEIQGLIWDEGYAKEEFKGHLYPDVKPFFERIIKNGNKIGIYSSGSVHAQKLIFGHSVEGNLTPFISYFFDTQVGGKREENSYRKISELTHLSPAEIHFFSDIAEELKAASAIGFEVTQLLRPGTKASEFKGIESFNEL